MKTLQNNFWTVIALVLGLVYCGDTVIELLRWATNPTAQHIIITTAVMLITAIIVAYATYTIRQEAQSRPTHK